LWIENIVSDGMKYAREHVKRYWGFVYRRNIGVSMLAFALALAIGTTFTSLVGSSVRNSAVIELIFWCTLIAIATLVLVISFIGAHISSTRLMSEKEHTAHSKHMGAWLAVLVLGTIAAVAPMLFFSSSMALIVFMFSFGGMLWILYLSVFIIFRHAYHELAIGAVTLWIAFLMSFTSVNNLPHGTPIATYALFVSTVMVITVAGVIGMAMLFNASREFVKEFRELIPSGERAGAARRRRASR
jgi:MFS family permease